MVPNSRASRSPDMADTLVLGLGNILLSDDGVGVRVIERLRELFVFPERVQVLDGGTLGLDLLPYLEGLASLVIVDAVQADREPGSLVRLAGEQIPVFLDACKLSPHQEGLQDLLAVAKLKGWLPADVVLLGLQAESLMVGLELSLSARRQLGALERTVLAELARRGIHPLPACQEPRAAAYTGQP